MDPTCTASPPLSSSLSLPYYWERLGYPKTVMAPMVAQSDLAFRKLCRAHGTQLCFTQMIHAHNFVSSESFQLNHLDVYPWGQESYVAPSGFRALKGCLSPLLDGNELAKGLDDASTNENVYDNDDEMDEDDSGGGYHDHDLDSMEYSTLSSTNQYKSGTIYDEGPIGTTASRITIDHEKNVWDGRKVDNHQHQDNTNHDQASQSHDVTVPIIHHSHPLIVQIAGNDPQTMSNAAKIILERTNHPQAAAKGWYHGPVAGIDVNCGCPQAIAKKGRYGAFLMEESEDLVCEIISTLRRDLPFNVGVSCKIRLPLQEDKLKERICKLIDAGVDLISVHGRTLKENKTKVRECNWDAIAKVVQIAKEYSQNPYFPIIANGGIEYSSDVDRCLAYTGASAVMSSEALLENPGIFQQSAKDDVDISPELLFQRQIRYCHEYLDLCTLYPPLPGSLGKIGGSFNCIRAHFFKIVHRYLEEHPDLRELLGHPTKVTSIGGARQLLYQLEQRYSNITDWSELRSSNVSKSSWYRRHREAAVTSRMSTRGQRVESELAGLSIEEKKNVMRERLRKLREQRLTQTN
jgi:tRNA-dihydrouridine synthase